MSHTYLKLVNLVDQVITKKFTPLDQILRHLEYTTRIRRICFVHVIVISTILLVGIGNFGEMTRNIVYYGIPVRGTLKALKSRNNQQYEHWLTYWAVFGFIRSVEIYTDLILCFIPFYSVLKLMIVAWCYAPLENNGAKLIYVRLIIPTMEMMSHSSLDEIGSKAIDKISETLKIKESRNSGIIQAETIDIPKPAGKSGATPTNEANLADLANLVGGLKDISTDGGTAAFAMAAANASKEEKESSSSTKNKTARQRKIAN